MNNKRTVKVSEEKKKGKITQTAQILVFERMTFD